MQERRQEREGGPVAGSKGNLAGGVHLEQCHEGSAGMSCVHVWGKNIPGQQHQGPDRGASDMYEDSKEAKGAGGD